LGFYPVIVHLWALQLMQVLDQGVGIVSDRHS